MSRRTDIFIKTLESLDSSSFDRFKRRLEQRGKISRMKLEKSGVDDTVDLMEQAYFEAGCGSVMSDILKTMNQNKLAFDLQKELEKEQKKELEKEQKKELEQEQKKEMNKNQLAFEVDKELQSGKLLLHSSMLSWLELME